MTSKRIGTLASVAVAGIAAVGLLAAGCDEGDSTDQFCQDYGELAATCGPTWCSEDESSDECAEDHAEACMGDDAETRQCFEEWDPVTCEELEEAYSDCIG